MSSTISTPKYATVIIGTGAGDYSNPLTNNSSITPPALGDNNMDTVGASGVYSDLGGGASLTNNGIVDGASGTYEGYYKSGGTGGIGVYLRTAGSSVTNNEGHIFGGTGGGSYDGSAGTGGVGVSLTGASSYLKNFATVAGGAGGYGGYAGGTGNGGAGGKGVVLAAGATASNYLSIQGGKGGKSDSGSGGAGGVGVSNPGGGALNNFDLIKGGNAYYGGAGGDGVDMTGGTLTNTFLSSNTQIGGGAANSATGNGSGGVGVNMTGGSVVNGENTSISGGNINTHNTLGTGNGGVGVVLTSGATLANSGNVAGGAATAGAGGVGVNVGANATAPTEVQVTNLSSESAAGHIAGGSSVYGTGGNAVDLAANTSLDNFMTATGISGGGSNDGTGGVGVDLTGTGAQFTNSGSVYGGSSGTGTAGAGVEMAAGTTVSNSGAIHGGASASAIGGVGVELNGGTLVTSGLLEGGSSDGNSSMLVDAVQFGSGHAQMDVESGATFYGDIGGFNTNSAVYIAGLNTTQVYDDFHGTYRSSHTLTLGAHDVLQFDGAFAGESFLLTTDGSGTLLTVTCYRRGTQILTERGEVAIESLHIGEQVRTLSGASRPIRWIGRRSYSGDLVWGNRDVLPILIRQGALEENVPTRDLWVSPEHAMYIDGMLIPAALLVNGVSIVQEEWVDEVSYFHLEFDSHEVIVAEGALSESFVDDESRQLFDNASEYHELHPQSPPQPARFCAPRVEDGYELEAVRQQLAARAETGRSVIGVESLANWNRIAPATTELRL